MSQVATQEVWLGIGISNTLATLNITGGLEKSVIEARTQGEVTVVDQHDGGHRTLRDYGQGRWKK